MEFQFRFIFLIYSFSNFGFYTDASRVLFIYPIASTSETHLFLPLAKSLAEKGHDITIVTPVKTNKLPSNIHQIVPTTPIRDSEYFVTSNVIDERKLIKDTVKYMFSFDSSIFAKYCHITYKNSEFKKLLKQKFDLILMSAGMNECFEGLVYTFQAPYIVLSSYPALHSVTARTGFQMPPSFVPISFFDIPTNMNFWDRFDNTIMVWLFAALIFMSNAENEQIYRTYLGQDVPSIIEIEKNLSLVMSNSHFSLNLPRPGLPDLIEIGGIHCRDSRPLPKDLEDFISSAEHGVIFFSLGSVVQMKSMPEYVRKIFLNVFSKLKQKVLWKWNEEQMSDLPPNVKLSKWLPQQDVLGHPNVKLFISHSGLLSTQESIYHGVPVLGIPLFADQDINILRAEECGFGIKEEILDMTEESLLNNINRLLTEPSFTTQAKKMSQIFKDQLETPLERATFWVEYVLRHKGAPQMKSSARELNFFQYHSLDVIGVIAGIFIAFIITIVLIVRWLCCSKRNKSNQTQSSQHKKNN